jgi:hypothetical protein
MVVYHSLLPIFAVILIHFQPSSGHLRVSLISFVKYAGRKTTYQPILFPEEEYDKLLPGTHILVLYFPYLFNPFSIHIYNHHKIPDQN